jgi:hypothetical protein
MPTYTCTYTKSVFVYEVTVLNQFLLTLWKSYRIRFLLKNKIYTIYGW